MREDKFGPRCRVHYAETPEEGIWETEVSGVCGKAEHGVTRGLCRNRSDLVPRRSRPGGDRAVRPRKTVIVSLLLPYRSWLLVATRGLPRLVWNPHRSKVSQPGPCCVSNPSQAGPWAACLTQAAVPNPMKRGVPLTGLTTRLGTGPQMQG